MALTAVVIPHLAHRGLIQMGEAQAISPSRWLTLQ
jgi:hypothetical protein